MNDEPTTALSIRLPKSIHKMIKRKAVRNVRSVNGEIIAALRRYVAAELPLPEDTPAELETTK